MKLILGTPLFIHNHAAVICNVKNSISIRSIIFRIRNVRGEHMAENSKKLGTVCVYCGAKQGKNPIFGEKAAGECELPAFTCTLHQV